MSQINCTDNIVSGGSLPSDAVFCYDCCLSREEVVLAPDLCVSAGDVVMLTPGTGHWAPPPLGLAAPLPAGTRFGIIFCTSHSTLDGVPSACTAIVRNAKFKKNVIKWPAGFPAAAIALVEASFFANVLLPATAI
jgi:hypothetical protein